MKKTKKLEEQIDQSTQPTSEMNDTIMEDILLEFSNSPAWAAYKRYTDFRLKMVDESLRSIDPFKSPTEMARNQGIRYGLIDLEQGILKVKIDRAKKVETNNEDDSPVP
jgi:hypothetical protein